MSNRILAMMVTRELLEDACGKNRLGFRTFILLNRVYRITRRVERGWYRAEIVE